MSHATTLTALALDVQHQDVQGEGDAGTSLRPGL